MPLPPNTKGKGDEMGKRQKTPVHRQPPLGGLLDFHAGFGVVTGRSSDLQAWPVKMTGVSTDPSSRFQRKPVVFGCSILLTAAGQSRIFTRFPLTFPLGTSPANEPQDRGLPVPCQPKCCGFTKCVALPPNRQVRFMRA